MLGSGKKYCSSGKQSQDNLHSQTHDGGEIQEVIFSKRKAVGAIRVQPLGLNMGGGGVFNVIRIRNLHFECGIH